MSKAKPAAVATIEREAEPSASPGTWVVVGHPYVRRSEIELMLRRRGADAPSGSGHPILQAITNEAIYEEWLKTPEAQAYVEAKNQWAQDGRNAAELAESIEAAKANLAQPDGGMLLRELLMEESYASRVTSAYFQMAVQTFDAAKLAMERVASRLDTEARQAVIDRRRELLEQLLEVAGPILDQLAIIGDVGSRAHAHPPLYKLGPRPH